MTRPRTPDLTQTKRVVAVETLLAAQAAEIAALKVALGLGGGTPGGGGGTTPTPLPVALITDDDGGEYFANTTQVVDENGNVSYPDLPETIDDDGHVIYEVN